MEIPGESVAERQGRLLEDPGPPVDLAFIFVSRMPDMEISAAEKEAIEKEWTEHNFYSFGEMVELNRNFIDLTLRRVYLWTKEGLPTSSLPEENLRFKAEYAYYLGRCMLR